MFSKYYSAAAAYPFVRRFSGSFQIELLLLFSAELKPCGYYLEFFWQADLGYVGQAIIGVKVPNSSHVACIQHGRVRVFDLQI